MGFDMFFQILRALECFSAEVALVGFEWHMDSDVRGDVVAFDGGCVALSPCTGQVQVIGRFTANMTLAHMLLMIISIDLRETEEFHEMEEGLTYRASGDTHRSPQPRH